ncbi:ankyrin repeat domain-containing protein [Rickettsia honei]|uniref:ankyrin repeat domain-containing protein n=1 Tax=Rickettsia honei TaxID=37816 RepID=UPI0002F4BAA0|nr:ankyrin repeat domain-containing protein [Rickettsia honei]
MDINIQGSFNNTVLHKAIYRKLYDIAKFLLEKGASTELKDLDGYTPLQLVIHEGYTEMVKFNNMEQIIEIKTNRISTR